MQTLKAFFAKLDLVHLLLGLTFVATVAIPDAVKAEDLLGLSKYAPLTLKVGTYVTGLLMLLKQFSPTADSVIQAASKLSSRGFAQLRLVAFLAVSGVALGVALVVAACSGSAVSGGQVVQDVTIGLNATLCVIRTYSQDVSQGKPDPLAVADSALKCGLSLAQAQLAVDGHKAAMVVEGYVLRTPADAGK